MSSSLPSKAAWHIRTPNSLPGKTNARLASDFFKTATVSSCFDRTASFRGVFPNLSLADGSALSCNRVATSWLCPSDAATC